MLREALSTIPLAGWLPIFMFVFGVACLAYSMLFFRKHKTPSFLLSMFSLLFLVGSFVVAHFWVNPFAAPVIYLTC